MRKHFAGTFVRLMKLSQTVLNKCLETQNLVSLLCLLVAVNTVADKELTLDHIFPADRVLDVQITVAEKDWDTIRHQKRNFVSALHESRKVKPLERPYTYVNASVTIDGVEFPEVGLRKKGFIGSESSSRPSLKIKLNHIDKKGGIDGLTNLTLNNNKQDTNLVSQFMGYALFNAAGSPAPRCAYARVTVNGTELGIYSHVERVRNSLLKRAFGNDNGTLYEGPYVDFYEGWKGSFEHKAGKDKLGRQKIEQLIKVLEVEHAAGLLKVEHAAGLLESDDKNIEDAIGELVDLDSFYTFWAVEGLLGFWDGYSGNNNNFLIYLNPKTDKFHFIPWGADSLFTKFSKLKYDPRAPISVKTQGLIAHKLYQQRSCRERYRKTLMNLMEKHWNEEKLLAETERIEDMVKSHLVPSQYKFADSLEEARKFIRRRRADIIREIADRMPEWKTLPNEPLVIEADAMPRLKDNSIWNAVRTGDIEAIQRHVSAGADLNAKEPVNGGTLLMVAAAFGQTEAARLLVKNGAESEARNNDGSTALITAAFFCHPEIVKLLLENGAKVNVKNNTGQTALDTVADEWSPEIEGIYKFVADILQIQLDLERIEDLRPVVANILRQHDAHR